MGLEALMSWCPEKMLIRCSKESQHPAVDPKTSGWASKRTRKTQRDGHNSGVKIWSLCSVSSTLSHANLEQPFRTLAIKWEVNMLLKKSSRVVYSCVCLWYCVVVMLNDGVDDYRTLLCRILLPGLVQNSTQHRCVVTTHYFLIQVFLLSLADGNIL